MAKRNIMLLIATAFLVTLVSVTTHSQARSSNQPPDRDRILREMQQKREEIRQKSEQRRKEAARKIAEFRSPARRRAWQEKLRARRKRGEEIRRELLIEKAALQPSEEQWQWIKLKLREIQRLRRQAVIGVRLQAGPSGPRKDAGTPREDDRNWTWDTSWDNKSVSRLSHAEKLVDRILWYLKTSRARERELIETMAALRESRKEAQMKLAAVRQELRRELTVRQQAVLMLMEYL